MIRPKTTIVGTLRSSEYGGALFSISLDVRKGSHPEELLQELLIWYYNPPAPDGEHGPLLEALPNAFQYENFANFPSKREFSQALHVNENYAKAANLLVERQRRYPELIFESEGERFPITF